MDNQKKRKWKIVLFLLIAVCAVGAFIFYKISTIHKMEKGLKESQQRFSNYNLYGNDGEYDRLNTNYKYAVHHQYVDDVEKAKKEMHQFEKMILAENKQNLKEYEKKLESMDTSKAKKNQLQEIADYKKKMKACIKKKQFKKADQVGKQWEKLIKSIQKKKKKKHKH